MSTGHEKKKPKKVVRAAELKPPCRISDADLDEICAVYGINAKDRERIRLYLDTITDLIAAGVRKTRMMPSRQADRDRLDDVLAALKKARLELESPLGWTAHSVLRLSARPLGPMIAGRWLRERFPSDELTAKPGVMPLGPPSDLGADPADDMAHCAGQWLDVEEDSLVSRIVFAERRPVLLISEILREMEQVMRDAVLQFTALPGARGGREPLIMTRGIFLLRLAIMWRGLGRTPATGPQSEFTAFCESVFVSVGWPTTGIVEAVRDMLDAVRDTLGAVRAE